MRKNIFEKKGGKLEKILVIIFLVLLISLGVLTVITANELTEDKITKEESKEKIVEEAVVEQNLEEIVEEEVVEEEVVEDTLEEYIEIMDLCENVVCEDSEIECSDGFVSSCFNVCDLETGDCSVCEPDCKDYILIENLTGETAEVLNEEISTLISDPESGPENFEIRSGSEPGINIQIFHLEKITRGEIVEVKATITNSGNRLKDISATWDLPSEFEIISGNKIENCGDLDTGEICELSIGVQPSISAFLGDSEIKISVNYKNGV